MNIRSLPLRLVTTAARLLNESRCLGGGQYITSLLEAIFTCYAVRGKHTRREGAGEDGVDVHAGQRSRCA